MRSTAQPEDSGPDLVRSAPARRLSAGWFVAAAVLVLTAISWTLLSREFVFGVDHTRRPILLFLGLYGLAWIAYAWSVVRTFSAREVPSAAWIVGVALAARIVLLPSGLIQENDVYRYVLDGQIVLAGGNPYEFTPNVITDFGNEKIRKALQEPAARTVLERLGYPWIATVYPPAAQGAFAAGAALFGWNWQGQRVIFLLLETVVILLLLLLLRKLGRNPAEILLYAWNPLPLKEIANSAHFDGLVGLWLLLVLLALASFRRSPHPMKAALGGSLIGAAILTKLYPAILIPASLVFVVRGRVDWKNGAALLAGCLAVTIAGVAPFSGIGWERATSGLSTYSRTWSSNEGIFGLLSLVTSQPRLLVAVFLVLLSLGFAFYRRKADGVEDLAGRFYWILILGFLVGPTVFPWYFLPVIVLGTVVSGSRRVTATISAALACYYLGFYIQYHDCAPWTWVAVRAVEHAVILGTVVACAASREMPFGEGPAQEASPGQRRAGLS